MEALDVFSDSIKNPGAYAEQWKAANQGKIVGHFCSYTPEEIITAAGALPFRIFGAGMDFAKADAHLQAYSCSLVRGGLEDALAGRLDFLDGTVFPHTCDSIMRLSDIWRMNIKEHFHIDVVLPVKLDTDSARAYMRSVMKKFVDDLQTALDTEITTDQLNASIRTYNHIRDNLSRLYQIRSANPAALPGSDLHTIFKAAMLMDRSEIAEKLETMVSGLSQSAPAKASRKRIVLTGGLCSMPDIYHIIDTSGGTVVWDDFCTGARYFDGPIPETEDPVAAIADRYLTRVVCPAKHAGIRRRGEYLIEHVKAQKADGVIFLFLKFCDPHAFDYPYMQKMLEEQGIPSMLFEIEDQLAGEGQLRTRTEAFIEML